MPVTHLIVGPAEHGVTRFGVDLVESLRHNGFESLASGTPPPSGGVHLQFTDRLFGHTPEQAADAVRALAQDIRRRGGKLTVTLHDLPQPSDGPGMADRAECYRAVSRRAAATVVSSDHEAEIVR